VKYLLKKPMTTNNVLTFFVHQKKIAAMLIATVLMWSVGLPLMINSAQAAGVTLFSDTLSDSDLGVVSNHTIEFTTSPTGQVIASESMSVTFESGFSIPDALDFEDIDLTVGGSDQTLAAAASPGIWGVSVATSTRTITFTSNNTTIGTSTAVIIAVGTNATDGVEQITNPGTPKSYTVDVVVGSSAQDIGTTRVAIIDDVTVTASVDTVFTFNIYGVATNTSPITGETATTTASTTATTIPFGTLEPGVPGFAAQQLSVTTNAANGFSVTVQQDGNLMSASTADIDTFVDGDATTTPIAWVPPSAVPGLENTYGHYGITSEDDSFAGATDPFGSGLYSGSFSSSSPLEVFYHNDPVNATTTYVAIKVEISSLQEAATDYTNTLTYVATPIF
jgi:hypothetical protein